jgi:Phosphoenolpyruvate carboxykinase (ATP)
MLPHLTVTCILNTKFLRTYLKCFLKRKHMDSMCMNYFIPYKNCTTSYRAAYLASTEDVGIFYTGIIICV